MGTIVIASKILLKPNLIVILHFIFLQKVDFLCIYFLSYCNMRWITVNIMLFTNSVKMQITECYNLTAGLPLKLLFVRSLIRLQLVPLAPSKAIFYSSIQLLLLFSNTAIIMNTSSSLCYAFVQ